MQKNKIADALKLIGIISIVLGIISGYFLATEGLSNFDIYDFSWSIFLISVLSSTVTGIILIGFSEVINILDNIKYNIWGLGNRIKHIEEATKNKSA